MLERLLTLLLSAFVSTGAAYAGAAFAPVAGMARAAACHRAGLCPGLILRPAPGLAAPAPRRGRAAVVMMAKKKLTETQRKALEALEAFEAVTRVAVQEEGPSEEDLEKEREKERKKEEKRLKKLAKKGLDPSAEAAQAGASDDDDADEAPKANGAQIAKAAPAVAKETTVKVEATFAAGDDLDFLGLDDDGGKPKMSKKKLGKTDKKAVEEQYADESGKSEDSAAAEAADALKDKTPKGRPSAGRVRIDTNVQPGYVRLALEKVTVNFKNQDVLTDATWQVQTGDRVGLVGANGGGKTTQLRILAGELEPTRCWTRCRRFKRQPITKASRPSRHGRSAS